MRPGKLSRLTWLAPPGGDPDVFRRHRARLERIAMAPDAPEIYAAKRRSIYRAEDAELGGLAVKEIRNRDPFRSLRFGYFQEHRALREFRTGSAFAARGGRTPEFLAAALDRGALGLSRVLIFLRWLDGAVTLTEYVAHVEGEPNVALLDTIARALVEPARLGLVHGRHSSDNLLVVERDGEPEIYPIDFAYSTLGEPGKLDEPGLIEDAARVAQRLVVSRACSRGVVAKLFDRIAAMMGSDLADTAKRRAALEKTLEKNLRKRFGARGFSG